MGSTSVHACVRDVFAIYDDNMLSRLIMIIIKIIILYFIQLLGLLCYMELKPEPRPNDRNHGLR